MQELVFKGFYKDLYSLSSERVSVSCWISGWISGGFCFSICERSWEGLMFETEPWWRSPDSRASCMLSVMVWNIFSPQTWWPQELQTSMGDSSEMSALQ